MAADAVLLCVPWPHPRYPLATVAQDLIAALHRLGRAVCVICDGFRLTGALGPDAVCYVEVPPDRPSDWRTAFARKLVFPSLSALLADDRHRADSLLGRVGVVQSFLDQLIYGSDHLENSTHYERTLADAIAERTGSRPRLIRARQDDMPANLDGFMRLTGIDYVELDPAERERILRREVDIAPLVAEHTRTHRDLLRSWGWDETYIENAVHHAWWLLHQLYRWREEVETFDAVVCLTPRDVEQTRDLLVCPKARNLTHVYIGTSFGPRNRARFEQLLLGYHRRGLNCYRAGAPGRSLVAFAPGDRKVVFVGRPARSKGFYELVVSLRDLYHSGRPNVRGIFVGPFWPELRQELAVLDPVASSDYLLFTGPVYDPDILAALLAFGDVTAAPSHFDAFCLVIAESYRVGTPCVVTEGTGAADAFLDRPRRNGVEMALPVRRRHRDGIARYFGVEVESLTAQLALLLDRPDVAGRLASDGERFVREHYSAERMGEAYSELYDLLLDGGPACRLYG